MFDNRPVEALAAAKKAAVEQQFTASTGGLRRGELEGITNAVRAVLGDSIALRLLPCGTAHLELGFIGTLLGRREYIQEERESLFSRYGQAAAVWTTVFQVAAVPEEPDGPPHFDPSNFPLLDDDGQISRGRFEALITGMLGYLEALGLVEGPRWPSVSVTPLGVYRTVPKA
jgi:hypothetical protein